MQSVRSWQRGTLVLPISVAVFCLAQGLDVITTAVGLKHGLLEANPLMSSILQVHGELAMYGLKLGIIATLLLAIRPLQRRYRRIWPILLVMALPSVFIVINNVAIITALRG